MSKYITRAIYGSGTKCDFPITGNSIDKIMLKIRKHKMARKADVYLFIRRRDNMIVETRVN